MTNNKKQCRRREGDVIRIDLEDGYYAFGRVLPEPLVGFYDIRREGTPPIEEIVAYPFLFKIWVMNYAITEDWDVIGNMPLTPDLREIPSFAKQDSITKKWSIYREGQAIPASPEQCHHLEVAAVWEPEQVVERLKDHFAGRPNKWVESMKPRSG